MESIIQIKSKLPLDFIQNLYTEHSNRIADKILLGMTQKRYTTMRVNTLKYSITQLEKYLTSNQIKFEKIEWYKDAVILMNLTETEIQKLEIYKSGYVYLQSLSSMIPPIVLNPKPGERILDLTAAPGSKTTEIAALMKNDGYILANEIDKIRCERLKHNIKMQGADIVEVINEQGESLGKQYYESFDKVLLDTPCSGEGRFLVNDTKSYASWSTKLVKDLTNIQKELLKSASQAVRKNGTIVYSTCTLNREENEKIIDWAVKNLGVEVLEINVENLKNDLIKINTKGLDNSIEKSIKIMPSKEMEGFFICKLQKI